LQKKTHSCGETYLHSKSLLYFNYSYAASIHKAQGSTINHVFIIEDDILEVKLTTTKEKLQSINVGISRLLTELISIIRYTRWTTQT
jgi:hypothetical protein